MNNNEIDIDNLITLQTLLKKKKALDLTLTNRLKNIKEDSKEKYLQLLVKKLKIFEYYKNLSSDKKYTFILDKNNKTVKNIYLYLGHIFNEIRRNQNFVYKMLWLDLKQTDKEIISSIVTHSLYENMFSSSLIEDEYLFLIYRSLKREISTLLLMQKPNLFLNNSINAYLLQNLIRKDCIQSYFKNIIDDIFVNLELGEGNKALFFSIDKICCICEEQESKIKKDNTNSIYQTNLPPSRVNMRTTMGGNSSSTNSSSNPNVRSGSAPEGVAALNDQHNNSSAENMINIQDLVESDCVFAQKDIIDQENFYKTEITKEFLSTTIQTTKDVRIKEYLLHKYFLCKKKDNFFSISKLNNKINGTLLKDYVKNYYFQSFLQVTNIIKIIIQNIKENLELVPYSVKFICKIISVLVKKKFPNISVFQRNAFVGQFFIEKLFKPIFTNPIQNCLLSKVFITKMTAQNLEIIQVVISKLFSGNFFNEKDEYNYTTFNLFFIEIMPQVFDIFDDLTQVQLPTMMQNFLDKELTRENFDPKTEEEEAVRYKFFDENPEEKINHTSVCLSIDEIETILSLIEKHRGVLLSPYKDNKNFHSACSKIMKVDNDSDDDSDNEDAQKKIFRYYKTNLNKGREMDYKEVIRENNGEIILSSFYNKKEEEAVPGEEKKNYVYYVILENEIEFAKILADSVVQEKKKKNNIENLSDFEITKKEFINNLTEILTNFQKLSKNLFSECHTSLEVFQKILKMSQLDYFKLNDTFFLSWSLKSIVQFLEKKNVGDTKLNVNEICLDLIKKTQQYLDSSPYFSLIDVQVGMEYFDKTQINYDNFISKFDEIEKHKFVDKFVEEAKAPVNLTLMVQGSTNEKRLVIIKKTEEHFKELDTFLFNSKKQEGTQCKTVQQFIKKFPNIFRPETRALTQSEDPFSVEKKLGFPEQLKKYFEYLRLLVRHQLNLKYNKSQEVDPKAKANSKDTKMEQKKGIEKKENPPHLDEYVEETINFIYKRIYFKLFPANASEIDNKIYERCKYLKEKNYEKSKFEDIDSFIAEMVEALTEFEIQNCPIDKAKCLIKSMESCKKINVFVLGKKDPGMDEFMPMFTYAIIQVVPTRIHSNIEFLKLYLDEKTSSHINFTLSIIEAVNEFILELDMNSIERSHSKDNNVHETL